MIFQHVQTFGNYIDYEAELTCFQDEGSSSVDARLTFVIPTHAAYITLLRRNDLHSAAEIGEPFNISWDEAVRLLGKQPEELLK